MFEYVTKVDSSGKETRRLKLHAATKRKLEFCNDLAARLQAACPPVAGYCEDIGHAIAGILAEAGEIDPPAETAVDEATEAKLDEIAPRPSKAG